MTTAEILALVSKEPSSWTFDEELEAQELLHSTPEPLPDSYVALLFAHGDAEESRLRAQGATSADLDD